MLEIQGFSEWIFPPYLLVLASIRGTSDYLSRTGGEGGRRGDGGGENVFEVKQIPDPKLTAFLFFGYPLRSLKKHS